MMSKAATPATKAREMVEEMRRKGDEAGADVWLRIIVAARLANRQTARDTKAQGSGSERHHVTLRPGDVILTGTPDGVGIGRDPRIYMKPGASLTTRIEGLGSITNKIVDSTKRK